MIHWGWAVAAGFAGAAFGLVVASVFAASAYAEMELAHFQEIRRLIKEQSGE